MCEPNGQGTRSDGKPVDVGICRGVGPMINVAGQGVFPPVALDHDWCANHPDFKVPKRARSNA